MAWLIFFQHRNSQFQECCDFTYGNRLWREFALSLAANRLSTTCAFCCFRQLNIVQTILLRITYCWELRIVYMATDCDESLHFHLLRIDCQLRVHFVVLDNSILCKQYCWELLTAENYELYIWQQIVTRVCTFTCCESIVNYVCILLF